MNKGAKSGEKRMFWVRISRPGLHLYTGESMLVRSIGDAQLVNKGAGLRGVLLDRAGWCGRDWDF